MGHLACFPIWKGRVMKGKSKIKTIVKDVFIACVIAILISIFISPTLVRETSMEPTIEPDDYLLLSRQAYRFGEVHEGDIVVFKSDIKLDEEHNKLLIKRVIATGGDIVTISEGKVYVNGEELQEDYTFEQSTTGEIYNLEVPEGSIFVMGDHRSVSLDSRKIGVVEEDRIVGKVIFRLYPFKEIGTVK